MANIRDLKIRINSIKNTKQITNAMKMVSAAKLRKAQEKIIAARPYANYIDKMIRTVKLKKLRSPHPLLSDKLGTGTNVLVIFTADRGLCGSFNSNIIRNANRFLSKNPETEIICVGKKGFDFFKKQRYKIIKQYLNYFNEMDFTNSVEISSYLLELFLSDEYNRIDVIYNEFKSAIQQNLVIQQILPIKPIESEEVSEVDFLYEPNENVIIEELAKKYIEVEIWKIMLESSAAEQGARMTAMDNATENAAELIAELSLLHNRARQQAITTEIIEIASGAEAINN